MRKWRNWTALLKLRRHRIWEQEISVCVCAWVSIIEPCKWWSRLCWPLLRGQVVPLVISYRHLYISHWLLSWQITVDITPGAPLFFKKTVFLIEFQSTQSEPSISTWRALIPTSCYVCLLSAKAVLSGANPAIIFHQGLEMWGWRGSSVCYSDLGSPALYGWGEGNHCYTWKAGPTGRETAPQGDSGEKGLAWSASTEYALAVTDKDRDTNRDTHTCTSRHDMAYGRSSRTQSHWHRTVPRRSAVTQPC